MFLWQAGSMDAFHYSIYVAIRTSPLRVRRQLASRLAIEGDAAVEELTKIISTALVRAYEIRPKPTTAAKWPSTGSR
jgi:hypothetical protein